MVCGWLDVFNFTLLEILIMSATATTQHENTVDAAKLLGQYTAGRFDIWLLAGPSKSTCRQHVMSVLVNGKDGKNLPKSKCGVYAIRDEFYKRIKPEGNCPAGREDSFTLWCKSNAVEDK